MFQLVNCYEYMLALRRLEELWLSSEPTDEENFMLVAELVYWFELDLELRAIADESLPN